MEAHAPGPNSGQLSRVKSTPESAVSLAENFPATAMTARTVSAQSCCLHSSAGAHLESASQETSLTGDTLTSIAFCDLPG